MPRCLIVSWHLNFMASMPLGLIASCFGVFVSRCLDASLPRGPDVSVPHVLRAAGARCLDASLSLASWPLNLWASELRYIWASMPLCIIASSLHDLRASVFRGLDASMHMSLGAS